MLGSCLLGLMLALPAWGQEGQSLLLGVMPYLNTRTLITNYAPLAAALEKSLGRPVQLQTAPDFDTFNWRTFGGDYDLVLTAPHFARLATLDYGYQPLLVHRNSIRCLIVTSRNAPLASTEDLRDQVLAIHERSAIVPMAAASWLADEGLSEGKDYRFAEAITQTSALHSAINGKARAAVISEGVLLQAPPEARQEALVFKECGKIPGLFLLSHNRQPKALQSRIKAALLSFEQSPEGARFFEATKHGGYREPTGEDARLMDKVLPETRRKLGM